MEQPTHVLSGIARRIEEETANAFPAVCLSHKWNGKLVAVMVCTRTVAADHLMPAR